MDAKKLAKLAADAAALADSIKDAANREGPGGKRVTAAEWVEILKRASKLLGDLIAIIPGIATRAS
jgi:hypothetical protein